MNKNVFKNVYHERILQSLQSRMALQELNAWIKSQLDKLDTLEGTLDVTQTHQPEQWSLSLGRLENIKLELVEMNEEIGNKRERELLFILDSIENELKQGFYDINITENCNTLEFNWNCLKQRLKNLLDLVDLTLLKALQFDSELNQLNQLIEASFSASNALELNKFNSDSTLIIDPLMITMDATTTTITAGGGNDSNSALDGDKYALDKLNTYKRELDALRVKLNENAENSLMRRLFAHKLDLLRLAIENAEKVLKVKLETNLTHLRQSFTTRINELYARLEAELNYLHNGNSINLFKP